MALNCVILSTAWRLPQLPSSKAYAILQGSRSDQFRGSCSRSLLFRIRFAQDHQNCFPRAMQSAQDLFHSVLLWLLLQIIEEELHSISEGQSKWRQRRCQSNIEEQSKAWQEVKR